MNVKHRALVVGLTAALAFGTCLPVAYATPQDDLAAASQQLESYGSQLAEYQESLEKQTADLEETSYRIGEKQDQIKETEKELSEAKAVLGGRMRSSYKSGSSSLIEVFLGADSLNDIVSRIYYMDKVATSDAESINQVKALEERLTTERADLEATKTKQQKAVDDLQAQVDEYSTKVEEARAYYDSLDAQIQQQIAEQQAAEENARIQAALEAAAQQEAQQQAEQQAEQEQQAAPQEQPAEQEEESTQTETSTPQVTTNVPSGGGIGSAYAAIGSPYSWGSAGPSSFDCSGLVCYCYGYARGRSTYEMISSLQSTGSWKTSMDQLSAGDLVFTSSGHVGIYLGGGQMIHAPHPGAQVCQAPVYAFYGGGTY